MCALSDASANRVALWGGQSEKTGALYARGKVAPEVVSAALRAASAPVEAIEGPAGLDLKPGEAVIFENTRATAENKQPKFYGYVANQAAMCASPLGTVAAPSPAQPNCIGRPRKSQGQLATNQHRSDRGTSGGRN